MKWIRKTVGITAAVAVILISGRTLLAQTRSSSAKQADAGEKTMMAFHDSEIQDVLRLIAEEYDLNMVVSDEVRGTVNLRLKQTSLTNTLDAILLAKGYDYEIRDNIIRVAPSEVIESERTQIQAKQEQEPLVTEMLALSYLDANDVKPMIESMLSTRGKVSVLEQRSYKGFKFGAQGSSCNAGTGSSSSTTGSDGVTMGSMFGLVGGRVGNDTPRSNTLMVVDIPAQIARIREALREIDKAPRQVLIDAKVLEVDTDTLEDLGLTFNNNNTLAVSGDRWNTLRTDINSDSSDTTINNGIFTDTFPSNTDSGLHMAFNRLNGEDFNVILHALLQDQKTKTLSSPQILTVENQEAAILVGEQFPIFEANVSDQGTATESLSFFLPVGVSLQVITQVTPDDDILMIIHPSVTSVGDFVTGSTGLSQPRVNIREADTRVLITDGDTLVIGGLLQDMVSEKHFRIPLLSNLPFVGRLFTRRQTDIDQRNLLIFITPRIIEGDTAALSPSAELTLKSIEDPGRYGFLTERRKAIEETFLAGKKNFENGHFAAAKRHFLRVYSLDPHHEGAIRYLEKLGALPKERPVG